jgi:hypothetical protein
MLLEESDRNEAVSIITTARKHVILKYAMLSISASLRLDTIVISTQRKIYFSHTESYKGVVAFIPQNYLYITPTLAHVDYYSRYKRTVALVPFEIDTRTP